jgi:2-polyprenyl-3-methyl-5-hydroxy-6-metoxy-1,4-benzoquinol methylase
MSNNKKAQETIDKIIDLMRELKFQLSDAGQIPLQISKEVKVPVKQTAHKPLVQQPVLEAASVDDMGSFESLKTALSSNKWPEAVNPHLICDPKSNDDKTERGRGVIELMIEEDLKGLKLLDFGCGEGHCTALSTEYNTTISVGYDTKRYDSWTKFNSKDNLLFTTEFNDALARGPFDVIILFDVIDHLIGEDPVNVLKKVASAMTSTGKIYMRTHPMVSRHGTHLYHDLNKAYVHLVFTPDELKQLIPQSEYQEPTIGVTAPIMTYEKYVKEAGLKIVNRRDITEKVEPFFKIPKIADRIMKNCRMNFFPEFQMSLQFIDYVLKKN